jgi:hypothetical protein
MTAEQIETAIRDLPESERKKLAADLPALLPELRDEAWWSRIIHDAAPRPALSVLLDEADGLFRENPENFPVMREGDFDEQA